MHKFVRISLIGSAIALILVVGGVSEASAQGVLKQILDRMDAHNKALVSLKADVMMVKSDSVLGENDTSIGTTSYLPKSAKRGMYVRLDWTKPAEERMVVIGDAYKIYRPRINQVITGKVDRAKNKGAAGGALAFMSMSEAQLKTNYKVSYRGEETISGGTATWHIELIPINKTSYKSADLWVDKNGMPLQAKVTEQNNDTTTVLLTNVQKNISIKADVFDLKVPRDAKEVKG